MKRCFLFAALITFIAFAACGNGSTDSDSSSSDTPPEPLTRVVEMSEERVLKELSDQLGFEVVILPYASRTVIDGVYYNIVVQDILGKQNYTKANTKSIGGNELLLARSDLILVPIHDSTSLTENVVLFNLDIYAYVSDKANSINDPTAAFDSRTEYHQDLTLGNPVTLKFSLEDYESTLESRLPAFTSRDRSELTGMFYYDPNTQKWFPIELLEKLKEIDVTQTNDTVTIQVVTWPKDDRIHIGH